MVDWWETHTGALFLFFVSAQCVAESQSQCNKTWKAAWGFLKWLTVILSTDVSASLIMKVNNEPGHESLSLVLKGSAKNPGDFLHESCSRFWWCCQYWIKFFFLAIWFLSLFIKFFIASLYLRDITFGDLLPKFERTDWERLSPNNRGIYFTWGVCSIHWARQTPLESCCLNGKWQNSWHNVEKVCNVLECLWSQYKVQRVT